MTTIISPRMLGVLGKFFPSTCTIQQNTPVVDTFGQPIASWADLAGHVDLDCAVITISGSRAGQQERRRSDGTITVATHTVQLAGYYDSITTAMRAVITGVNYDVLAVEHDSQSITTRLLCEVVT